MKHTVQIIVAVFLLTVFTPVKSVLAAGGMLMIRSSQTFPETMLALQTSIAEHGYTVSRVQRVDIGLTKSGFKTDKYRIVFFGKLKEYDEITRTYPQLIPYLPLKIAIFAEESETLLIATRPSIYKAMVDDKELQKQFVRWENDMQSIFNDVRKAHEK